MDVMASDLEDGCPRWTWLLLIISVALVACLGAYIYLGVPAAVLSALGTGLSLIGWRATTYQARGEIRPVVVPMVLTTVASIALVTEGFLGGLPARMHALSPAMYPAGTLFDERSYVIVSYTLFALFTFGAYGLWRRHPLGEYMAWLVFCHVGADALGHLVYPLLAGGGLRYFPGMLASPVALALGVIGVRALVVDHRSAIRGG